MRKLIAAIVVVLVVGIGGYLGVTHWAQQAAAREVDAMLDQWRASLGTVTRGRVDFDLWTRTVKVSDLVAEPRSAGQPRIAVAQVVASGIDTSGKADRIELTDLDIGSGLPGPPGVAVHQKAGRVTLTAFSARPLPPRPAPANALEQTRLWLEQFSAITAASIEVPSLTISITPTEASPPDGRNAAAGMGPAGVGPAGVGPAEYTYRNLVLREVREGRVAEVTMDGLALRSSLPAPMRELSGEIGRSSVTDVDLRPLLAVLDPAQPGAQGPQRIYGRMSMGPYTLSTGSDGSMTIDSIVAEDIGVQPSKLVLDDMVFLSEVTAVPGAGPMPGQPGMLMDKLAGLYEAFRVGRMELRGFSFTGPGRAEARIAGIRVEKLHDGRFGEIVVEDVASQPQVGDPFKLGRFSVKGFDFAGLMRLTGTQLSQPLGQPRPPAPDPEQIAAMLRLIEGIELKDVAVPDPRTRRTVQLESLNASWGQLVGGVPSQSRVSMKFSAPIRAPDPEPFINLLAGAGMQALTAGLDIGAAWSESSQAVTLAPASMEIDGAFALSVKASAANVSRDMFSTDVLRAMGSLAMVEVGPIEVTLRDLGLIDLVAGEIARPAGQGLEAGRSLLLQAWEAQAQARPEPEVQTFLQAMRGFVQGKGETLTVRLTPKGRVRVLEFAEALKLDPAGAVLAGFTLEATSGR